jgi:hypothetical protein
MRLLPIIPPSITLCLLASVTALLDPRAAWAQDPAAGTLVRVDSAPALPGHQWLLGRWRGREPEGLVIQLPDGSTALVPAARLGLIEVQREGDSRWLDGLVVGTVIGAALGLALEARACSAGSGEHPACVAHGYAAFGGIGAGLGGLIGVAAGAARHRDIWVPLKAPGAAIRITPGRHGIHASLGPGR